MKLKTSLPFLFALAVNAAAQLPTNNLPPAASAVMTLPNGTLSAPANFFAANSNAVNAAVAANLVATNDSRSLNFGNAANTFNGTHTGTFSGTFTGTFTGTHVGPGTNTLATNALTAANVTGVVALANGGLGFADTNYVPTGAAYDDGSSDFGINGDADPVYGVTLIPNAVYVVSFGANEDSGLVEFYCASTNTYGYFYTLGTNLYGLLQLTSGQAFTNAGLVSNRFYLDGRTALGAVTAGIYQKTNTFSGSYLGDFQGPGTLALGAGSSIPQSVVQAAGAFINGSRLNGVANGGLEHYLVSTNTASGSTLSLFRAGTNGYADINFFTYSSTNVAPPNATKLWFAIGVGASGAAFPYQQPYIESYLSQYPFYFVGSGAIFGGLYCSGSTIGNFVWFQDGTTNTPMFQIDRASKSITNYYQTVFGSNAAFRPNTAFAGTVVVSNGLSAIWNSNGVATYLRTSTVGSTTSTDRLLFAH